MAGRCGLRDPRQRGFFVGIVFIGFDPENLALGTVASHEQSSGLALGSVVGAAMVAVAWPSG